MKNVFFLSLWEIQTDVTCDESQQLILCVCVCVCGQWYVRDNYHISLSVILKKSCSWHLIIIILINNNINNLYLNISLYLKMGKQI